MSPKKIPPNFSLGKHLEKEKRVGFSETIEPLMPSYPSKKDRTQEVREMPSLEEVKRKLASSSWLDRRDAVRELGQMKGPRGQIVPLLKQRLIVDDDGNVIEEIVNTLNKLQSLDAEAFKALKRRIDDEKISVRRGTVIALQFFQEHHEEVISLLIRRMETEDDGFLTSLIIRGLHQLDVTVEQMSRILARNAHFPMMSRDHDLHPAC